MGMHSVPVGLWMAYDIDVEVGGDNNKVGDERRFYIIKPSMKKVSKFWGDMLSLCPNLDIEPSYLVGEFNGKSNIIQTEELGKNIKGMIMKEIFAKGLIFSTSGSSIHHSWECGELEHKLSDTKRALCNMLLTSGMRVIDHSKFHPVLSVGYQKI